MNSSPLSASQVFRQLLEAVKPRYEEREARAVARWYVEEKYGLTQTEVLMDKALPLSPTEREALQEDCRRLAEGVPVQHVLGFAPFMGHRFVVNSSVLIPRPETEELVQWAWQCCGEAPVRMLDAGTGSGCIAISLAQRLPLAQVSAWDISPAALSVARANAAALGVEVDFVQCDLIAQSQRPTFSAGSFDLLVSNPPYIRQKEMAEMEAHVVDHEPHLALFVPDYDPLLFYRALAQLGQHLLTAGGRLLVECHRDCVQQVADLFSLLHYVQVEVRNDCFGLPRFVGAKKM